jgi:hypothetical protein
MHLNITDHLQMKRAFLATPQRVHGVSRCRALASGLSAWGPGVDPTSVHVGFLVDKTALGQIFV